MPHTPSRSVSGSHPSPRPSSAGRKRKKSKQGPHPIPLPHQPPQTPFPDIASCSIPNRLPPSTTPQDSATRPFSDGTANKVKKLTKRQKRKQHLISKQQQALSTATVPTQAEEQARVKSLKAQLKKAKYIVERNKRKQAQALAKRAKRTAEMDPVVIESTASEDQAVGSSVNGAVVVESSIPNQADSVQQVDQQQEFVGNVDFIAFGDSDDGRPGSTNKRAGRSTNDNQDQNSRGTKRKFATGPGVTEEEADVVRKKKGLIITPWFDRLEWKGRSVQQMLTAEIGSFVAYIKPTPEEDQLRQMIIELIRKAVQSRWPDADVEPFGSFGTKLYLPGGDIDLVILSSRMMSEQKSKVLYKLAPIIREQNIGQDVVVIAKAKVPIIKFKTIFGSFNVDISVNQSNGLKAMSKVNELLDDIKYLSIDMRASKRRSRDRHQRDGTLDDERDSEDEQAIRKVVDDLGAAKCLILVIKSVLKQRGMNEVYTGGLGSYSIICLVISFLQLHPKIQRGDIDPNKNLGVLLLEFFELYGKHYNFNHTGISVRKGGYYFSKAQRGWSREKQPNLLSIEDPADETNDISGGTHNILGVRSVFSGAFDLLSATLYHRHSLQTSRAAASSSSSSAHPLLSVPVPQQQDEEAEVVRDPMAQSLLGEIMGVTKELVEQRKKNLKLFSGGTLQRLLRLPMPDEQEQMERGKSKKSGVGDRGGGARESSRSKKADDSRRGAREGKGREAQPEIASPAEQERASKEGRKRDSARRNSGQEFQADSRPARELSRQRLRYDDLDEGAPKPGSRASRKGKGKASNQDPAPLWVEDVVPSEVGCLKGAHMVKPGAGLAGHVEDERETYRDSSATKAGLQDGPDQSGSLDHLGSASVSVDRRSGGSNEQGKAKTGRNVAKGRDGSSSPELPNGQSKRRSSDRVDSDERDELDSRYSGIAAAQRSKRRQVERLLGRQSDSDDSLDGLVPGDVGRGAGACEEYFVDDDESEDGDESATIVQATLVPARQPRPGGDARAESPSPALVRGLKERAKRMEYRLHLMGHRPRVTKSGSARAAAAEPEQGGYSSPGTPPGTPPGGDEGAGVGRSDGVGTSPGTPPGSPPVTATATAKVTQMDKQKLWLSKAGRIDEEVIEEGGESGSGGMNSRVLL